MLSIYFSFCIKKIKNKLSLFIEKERIQISKFGISFSYFWYNNSIFFMWLIEGEIWIETLKVSYLNWISKRRKLVKNQYIFIIKMIHFKWMREANHLLNLILHVLSMFCKEIKKFNYSIIIIYKNLNHKQSDL